MEPVRRHIRAQLKARHLGGTKRISIHQASLRVPDMFYLVLLLQDRAGELALAFRTFRSDPASRFLGILQCLRTTDLFS